jgi:hypothetical protein
MREMRKRAIGLMAETYRSAETVLVIDQSIRSCSILGSIEEKLLRILCSGWMQRLWTLQEGTLAQKLVFKFSDGFYSFEELLPTEEDDLVDPLIIELASELFRLQKNRLQGWSLKIADVVKALTWRTTSRASDETLAIAGLLNVDAYKLAQLEPKSRIRHFLIEVRELPSDIIFMIPKLHAENFHWAPATLIAKKNFHLSFGKTDAICDSNGLSAVYFSVFFPPVRLSSLGGRCIMDNSNNGNRYYRVHDVSEDQPSNGDDDSCDALLLTERPKSYEWIACAAVKQKAVELAASNSSNLDRFKYRFLKRLMLENIDNKEFGKEQNRSLTIIDAHSGRMNVFLT